LNRDAVAQFHRVRAVADKDFDPLGFRSIRRSQPVFFQATTQRMRRAKVKNFRWAFRVQRKNENAAEKNGATKE
jgi:hypothetical protein